MVDYELFKKLLSEDDDGYIEAGDYIDFDTIKLFANSRIELVKGLFKKNQADGVHYTVQYKCPRCGTFMKGDMSKTSLLDVVKAYKKCGIICSSCMEENNKKEEEERKQRDAENEERMKENTRSYIYDYLNPNMSWNQGVKTWEKIEILRGGSAFREVIENYIKSMDYKDFLKTPYWKAISEKVKQRAGFRCSICNGTENLAAHHRTYEHHGAELYHLDDLICICSKCHEKYHDITHHEKG